MTKELTDPASPQRKCRGALEQLWLKFSWLLEYFRIRMSVSNTVNGSVDFGYPYEHIFTYLLGIGEMFLFIKQ